MLWGGGAENCTVEGRGCKLYRGGVGLQIVPWRGGAANCTVGEAGLQIVLWGAGRGCSCTVEGGGEYCMVPSLVYWPILQ